MNYELPLVLHIDDDPAFTRLTAVRLSAHGFPVRQLHDPMQWERVLLETNARVVLLDLDFPDGWGLDLLRAIKRLDGGVQVVVLTGLAGVLTTQATMQAGAWACLFKPVRDFDVLAQALRDVAAHVRLWEHTALGAARRTRSETCAETDTQTERDEILAAARRNDALGPQERCAARTTEEIDRRPARRDPGLEFADFLVARGAVRASQVAEAVEARWEWQPRFGALCVRERLLEVSALAQVRLAQAATGERFGDAAQRLGLLRAADVERVLALQAAERPSLGEVLVRLEALAPAQWRELCAAFAAERRGDDATAAPVEELIGA